MQEKDRRMKHKPKENQERQKPDQTGSQMGLTIRTKQIYQRQLREEVQPNQITKCKTQMLEKTMLSCPFMQDLMVVEVELDHSQPHPHPPRPPFFFSFFSFPSCYSFCYLSSKNNVVEKNSYRKALGENIRGKDDKNELSFR